MTADAVPALHAPAKARSTLVRLFGARPPATFDDLARRSDPAMLTLFEGAESGLLLIDRGCRIARANPAARALLAAGVDLTQGAPAAAIFAEAEQAAVRERMETVLAGRVPDCRIDGRLRLAVDGPDRRIDIGCRLVREADGSVGGLLMRVSDITSQARQEAQLARNRELAVLGTLVGGVAHDFNNLLTTILGAIELVQERSKDAATHADLEQVRKSAERGAALVRNLLALGRQQHLQATPLDVNATLHDVADLVRPALGRHITVDLQLEEPGRHVRVDPGQLEQVLMNLAINAGHAMPEGGRLTLRTDHATLYRNEEHGGETIPPGRYVIIAVEDTGCGIPKALLGRIFEPFFTTRRAQGGSGLGLASAHGIVRQSGGFLTVESEVGKGTTFRIYLPREDARRAIAEASSPDAPSSSASPSNALSADANGHAMTPAKPPHDGTPRRVLLVDDERALRRVTARALTRHGWQVVEAESAEAALATLDEHPGQALTALVSDIVMPGQDGAALVDAVRAQYPDLPAILVSGYAERLLENRTAQAVIFMSKPYSPKALLAALDEITPDPTPSTARGVPA